LACGLPCVVTPASGSVVRDGVEGFLVGPGDVNGLAQRMEQLGGSPKDRAGMSTRARSRALEFDWPRYHAAIVCAVTRLIARVHPRGTPERKFPHGCNRSVTKSGRTTGGGVFHG
jgi:hypothetical protein